MLTARSAHRSMQALLGRVGDFLKRYKPHACPVRFYSGAWVIISSDYKPHACPFRFFRFKPHACPFRFLLSACPSSLVVVELSRERF